MMSLIWITSTTNYFMILYLMNTFEQVYVCSTASSLSEMLAYLLTGYVLETAGIRKTYIGSFGMAFVGGVVLLGYGLEHQDSWTFILMVILAKFGIVITQGVNYAAHPDIFPTLFSSTSFGYLVSLSYIFSSLSNMISRIPEPIPILIFSCSSAIGALVAYKL